MERVRAWNRCLGGELLLVTVSEEQWLLWVEWEQLEKPVPPSQAQLLDIVLDTLVL